MKQSLASVVVIAVVGILAGAAGSTSIAEWAKSKSVLFNDLLSLEYGVTRTLNYKMFATPTTGPSTIPRNTHSLGATSPTTLETSAERSRPTPPR